MKDLLKEAIADAKAVRETALANAKIALEEAFTPRLQSMLSAKLSEEMEDEEMTEEEEVEDVTEGEDETGEEMPEEDEMPEEEEMPEEDEDDEEDVDLEEIIRELEGDEEEMVDEELESSEIGDYDGDLYEEDEMEDEAMPVDEDEEVDINEIIRSLREEDEMEDEAMPVDEDEEVSADDHSEELEEAYNVIRFLKGKINEVNLLNAKLLYSNKLFRSYQLSEGQKMKVIENFDRAHSLREVKLVFSTLAEGFKLPGAKRIVKESYASKPVASTRPGKQVLSEGAELANRFRKLAGLI